MKRFLWSIPFLMLAILANASTPSAGAVFADVETIQSSSGLYRADSIQDVPAQPRQHEVDTTLVGGEAVRTSASHLRRGFRGLIDLGVHFGLRYASDCHQLSAAFTGGYQFNKMVFLGAGMAPTFNLVSYDGGQVSFILPIYSAFRMDFIDNKISPFVDLRLGFYMNIDHDLNTTNAYLYAGAGVRLHKFSLGAGYERYETRFSPDNFAAIRVSYEF